MLSTATNQLIKVYRSAVTQTIIDAVFPLCLTHFQQWIDPNKPVVKYVTKDDRQNCKLQFRVKVSVRPMCPAKIAL